MPEHVDGNVLAGALSELFSVDMTVATGRCASCGDVAALAQAMVWDDPTGLVVRCAACDDVLMVLIDEPGHVSIELRGLSWLQVAK